MAAFCSHFLRQASRLYAPFVNSSPVDFLTPRLLSHKFSLIRGTCTVLKFLSPSRPIYQYRSYSHGTVNLVVSKGKIKFKINEVDPPKKEKFLLRKRFVMKIMRGQQIRKAANRNDPRRLPNKKKGQKFATAEEKMKDKIKMAKAKEEWLVKCLRKYEVRNTKGHIVKPHELTGEERFYLEKTAQKRTNYVQVGRRGLFGGLILNMHMHWKKHETVKVFFKPCKPGQIIEYVQETERLSGGIVIRIVDDDTAIFYRGKNYIMPRDMSPSDAMSRKQAYSKSRYEQTLETVRHYIAVSEKELELYYRHMSLYSNKTNQSHISAGQNPREDTNKALNLHFADSAQLESITEFTSWINQSHISEDQNPREDTDEDLNRHLADSARLESTTEFASWINQSRILAGQNKREDTNKSLNPHFADSARLELTTEFASRINQSRILPGQNIREDKNKVLNLHVADSVRHESTTKFGSWINPSRISVGQNPKKDTNKSRNPHFVDVSRLESTIDFASWFRI